MDKDPLRDRPHDGVKPAANPHGRARLIRLVLVAGVMLIALWIVFGWGEGRNDGEQTGRSAEAPASDAK